jgi:hypothetical protein
VHTGIFDKEYSKLAAQASAIRGASDYDDFYIADKAETQAQVEGALAFYRAVEAYLNGRFENK